MQIDREYGAGGFERAKLDKIERLIVRGIAAGWITSDGGRKLLEEI